MDSKEFVKVIDSTKVLPHELVVELCKFMFKTCAFPERPFCSELLRNTLQIRKNLDLGIGRMLRHKRT